MNNQTSLLLESALELPEEERAALLNGLFDNRKAGTHPGYTYSAAYKSLDKVWSEDNFRVYIKDPRGVTPGTKMIYPGLKDDAQITNLIAYLKQFGPDGKKK